MSMSTSTGSSSSSSTSQPIETRENDIIDQISGVASRLAGQMQSWANGVFAQTSAITNQAVGNFFQISQKMAGLSNRMTDQYNNVFAPENAQLVDDANSYNSAARQKVDMGMAGATQAQAGDHALQNSEAALKSYGINPADGRYAALDKAAAVQNSANIAGAQNLAREADVKTGQNLRTQAVQVGAQLPAAIANVNNTSIQANTGAANAIDANANTGRNLMSLPNDFLKTAMDVKLPFNGTMSSGRSNNQSNGQQPQQQHPQQGGNGGNNGGNSAPNGSSQAPAWMPQHGGGDGGGGQVSSYNFPDYSMGDPTGGTTADQFSGDYYQPQDGYSMDVGQQGTNPDIWNNDQGTGMGQGPDQYNNPDFGQTYNGGSDQTYNGMGGGTDTQYGNISYDPGQNNQYDTSGFGDYSQLAPTDWGNGADQYTAPPSDNSYAAGGAIHGAPSPHAGTIPAAMSPSGGQQTDDIQAQGPGGQSLHMNANEFVIPQDVALWKGQEFFQNLIDQSRKKRVTASAQPQQQQQQPQQPGM